MLRDAVVAFSRALLGSVAEKVVQTACVPVLTVHPTDVATTALAGEARQESPASARTVPNADRAPPSHH